MVSRVAALILCLLGGCALQQGTVLIVRDAEAAPDGVGTDAATDGEALLDAPAPEDSANDASADATDPPDAGVDAAPTPRGVCRIDSASQGFLDGFGGSAVNADNWLIAQGPVRFAGRAAEGGFARENVSVEAGALVLRVRGDRYTGSVRGVDLAGNPLPHGRRTAAAVASRDLFASGTYQAQGVFAGPPGLEVALWFVRDDDSAGAIDIATPGFASGQSSSAHVRMRSRDASSSSEQQFALAQPFAEGEAHILRFDWYTTANNAVDFWIDDVERWQTEQSLPSKRAGRLWIVAWVPEQAPADFDTAEVRIDVAFIRPFANDGDQCRDLELAGPFLVEP